MSQESKEALVLEGIHPKAVEILTAKGFQVTALDKAPSGHALKEKIKGKTLLCSRSRTEITEDLLSRSLSAIGAFCIGVNQIDLSAAARLGIPVFNAPYSNTRSVAEMTAGLILALARRLFPLCHKMRKGVWDKSPKGSYEVRGKTLAIIGYGHIGSQVSVLAEGLGMHVIYYDIAARLPLGNAVKADSMQEALKHADFITLHVPETEKTIKMIGPKELALMKESAFLINTGRGKTVEIDALKEALVRGGLQGAALDVFPKEPSGREQAFENPFEGMDQVILTPHVAGSTEEAQQAIAVEVSESLLKFFEEGSTVGAVNFPALSPGALKSSALRMMNVHKNRPGALSRINKEISRLKANIQAQWLATNESVGCLIMDVERQRGEDLLEAVSRLPLSIKTRILPRARAQ